MKQVININFQGSVVPIEVSAYEMLKNYIESLSRHFAAEEGKDEIINDIESRVAELFQERLKAGATCIVDEDVQAVMNSIGRPEDLAGEETSANTQQQNNQNTNQQESTYSNTSGKRRLFRDENHKIVGGVCSGIANYFDIDIAIVRIVFLILLFSFGVGFIPYIILWIAVPSSAVQVIGSRRKKLYRDLDEKYLGGVCSGISHYFGVNVWIPRLLFLLPMISFAFRFDDSDYGFFPNIIHFSPSAFIIYIILWLVLPEAKTTTEKLEMKGEKVDMNSIKESVTEEIKGVQERAQKFGKEVMGVASEKGKAFGGEAKSVARKGGRSLGDVIVFIVKAFAYFIIGVVGISLVISLFAGGIVAIRYFSLKDFLITDGWQNFYTWGVLLFFIIAPMIGIITWIIRKITRVKAGSKILRLSFIAMWIIGWLSLALLGASLSNDFKHNANINEQSLTLSNPTINSLEITDHLPSTRYTRKRWFNGDFFDNVIDEDTISIRNVAIHIIKSPNDSFKVTTIKLASGSTRKNADSLASLINFNAFQQDSLFVIDNTISINKTEKLRNQRVILTVYVPVGKRIKINGHVGRTSTIRFNGPFSVNNGYDEFDNISFDNVETGWGDGTWYTMTKDGLVTADGKPANYNDDTNFRFDENGIDIRDGKSSVRINENGISVDDNIKSPDASNGGTYRYEDNKPKNKYDSIKINLDKAEQNFRDSIQKEKDKIDKQVESGIKKETSSLYKLLPGNLLMGVL